MSRREDSEGPGRLKTGRGIARPSRAAAAEPVRIFSRAAIREVDRLASDEFGLPSLILMENAAIGLADVAVGAAADRPGSPVLVVCGRGNNGGDGLAAARHVHNAGLPVAIVLASRPEEVSGDAAVHLRVARAMGLRIVEADAADPRRTIDGLVETLGPPGVVIDAVLGTGLDRPVRGTLAAVIAAINATGAEHGATIIAADIPSGLDADTGAALAENPEPDGAVRADVTVTFAGLKRGFQALEAQAFVGEVVVRPIGVPVELLHRLGEALPKPAQHPGQPAAPPLPPDGPDADERGVHPGESGRTR